MIEITTAFYAYLNSAWVDITSDVLAEDRVYAKWGLGLGVNDRIADTGVLQFALKNSTGKYSPNGSGALSGWKKGVAVKMTTTYQDITRVRFRGTVDSVQISAGTLGQRKAYVTVLDWLGYAERYPLVAPDIELNVTADTALGIIVPAMPITPLATSYDVGNSVFPTAFDTVTVRTKAYTELAKLAQSEPGYIYVKKDATNGETLVFEASDYRNGLRVSGLAVLRLELEARRLLPS